MPEPDPRTVALVGPGRAGSAIVGALRDTGWTVSGVAGRTADGATARIVADALGATAGSASDVVRGAGLVVIATPDAAIAGVVEEISGSVHPETLVIHLAGSFGPELLGPLPCRRGAMHPLQTFPSPELGRTRLAGSAAAVAGDPAVAELARSIGLQPFTVDDDERARYHAAACIASNHLVALLAQVDACTTVPLEAFLPLVRATVENVSAVGPAAALTGPVARGDVGTVRRHLDAIPPAERAAYVAMARRAARVAGRPEELEGVLG